MRLDCTMELEYATEAQAKSVFKAIDPDNGPFAQAAVDGKKVVITSSAETPLSLLHTMEDLLACVRVAEEASKAASECPL